MHTVAQALVASCLAVIGGCPAAHGLAASGLSNLSRLAAAAASSRDIYVLVDVENVRGRSDFALSHGQLLDRAAVWARRRGLRGRVVLVVDHGSEPTGHHLPGGGLAVVFSGNQQKADDVIVRDVAYAQGTLGLDVFCVTRDQDLIRRCHQAGTAGSRRSQIIAPSSFLEDLESAMAEHAAEELEGGEGSIDSSRSPQEQPASCLLEEMAGNLELEINLWGDVLRCETELRRRRRGSKKKRSKIAAELERHRERLAELNDAGGQSTLERVTAINPAASNEHCLSRQVQDELVSRWHDRRRRSLGYVERTGDRIVLAEMLRRQLLTVSTRNQADPERVDEPALLHASHANVIAARLPGASPSMKTALLVQGELKESIEGRS